MALELRVFRTPFISILVWYTCTYQRPTIRGLQGVVGLPPGMTANLWRLGVVRVSARVSLKSFTPLVVSIGIVSALISRLSAETIFHKVWSFSAETLL